MTVREKSNTATTWVLVADRGSARLFSMNDEHELVELAAFTNDGGTSRVSSLVSDRQGYFKGREGSLQSGDAKTDFPHKSAAGLCASMISTLESGRTENEFQRLIIFAAPLVLGMLRKDMPAPLAALVAREVDKDLAGSSVNDIRDRLMQL